MNTDAASTVARIRSHAESRFLLIVLSAAHLASTMCIGAVPAMLPFLIEERHFTYAQASSLVMASTFSSLLQPAFGQLADRRSMPWLMPAGLLVSGVTLAASGLLPGYTPVFIATALCGIGIAAFLPEGARMTARVSGKNRSAAMSVYAIGGNFGMAAAPVFLTPLLLRYGVRGSVGIILPTVALAAVVAACSRLFSMHSSDAARTGMTAGDSHDAWKPFALLTLVVLCRSVVVCGLRTFVPLYWIDVLGSSELAGATALTIFLTGGAAGQLLGGILSDRYGRTSVLRAAMALIAPLCLLLLVLRNQVAAAAVAGVIGVALFAPFSVLIVLSQEYLPGHIGLASGVTMGLATSFGGVFAPLLGSVADSYGLRTALVLMSFIPVIAALLAGRLPRPAH